MNKLLSHIKITIRQDCERIFKIINYERAVEDNNELELKVDEQQHNIQNF